MTFLLNQYADINLFVVKQLVLTTTAESDERFDCFVYFRRICVVYNLRFTLEFNTRVGLHVSKCFVFFQAMPISVLDLHGFKFYVC